MNMEQFWHNYLPDAEPEQLKLLLVAFVAFVIGIAYGCWGMSRRLRNQEELRRWREEGDSLREYRRSTPPHPRQFPAR